MVFSTSILRVQRDGEQPTKTPLERALLELQKEQKFLDLMREIFGKNEKLLSLATDMLRKFDIEGRINLLTQATLLGIKQVKEEHRIPILRFLLLVPFEERDRSVSEALSSITDRTQGMKTIRILADLLHLHNTIYQK